MRECKSSTNKWRSKNEQTIEEKENVDTSYYIDIVNGAIQGFAGVNRSRHDHILIGRKTSGYLFPDPGRWSAETMPFAAIAMFR